LNPNCPGMIIGRSSVFYADRKSKMAATTGHSINTGPYGENTEIYYSLKLLLSFHTLLYNMWSLTLSTAVKIDNSNQRLSRACIDHLGLNCAPIIGRSFTNFVFFMLIVIPRCLPLQDIVFT
jgi:hypothetical protein